MIRGEKQVFFTERQLALSPAVLEKRKDTERESDENAAIVIVKTGGHFPGSTVLWWKPLKTLLSADTIAVVPSGRYWVDRPKGTASFTFLWSYPNMV